MSAEPSSAAGSETLTLLLQRADAGDLSAAMGNSERTAKRDWAYARVWLLGEMRKPG